MAGDAIRETADGVLMEVRVRPNARRFALSRKDGQLVLEVTSPPQEGKANMEIVKGLRRLFGKDVEIVSGLKSKSKMILVRNTDKEEIETKIRINNQ
jgi:uncharacterized protein (TIGR00251 family)